MKVKPLVTVQKEDWINRKWRPLMAVSYMAICLFDFIVAPVINYAFFGRMGTDFISWKPLTMSDGGMFHIAMGAVLGITAWQRGEEKKTRYRNDYEYEEPEYDRADHRDRLSSNSSREG
jgi:hypothetical protein